MELLSSSYGKIIKYYKINFIRKEEHAFINYTEKYEKVK